MKLAKWGLLAAAMAAGLLPAQSPLVSTGTVRGNGQARPYTVRHLPPSAYPDLPAAIAQSLTARNCTIPQSYEARAPENVVHGSFERAGSSDWAVLCSVHGTVSLLVFFASAPQSPVTLASAQENTRVQPHPGSPELGFNWAIDTASPQRVHDAQIGLSPRPPLLDHDALADSTIERRVIYRYFANGAWAVAQLPT